MSSGVVARAAPIVVGRPRRCRQHQQRPPRSACRADHEERPCLLAVLGGESNERAVVDTWRATESESVAYVALLGPGGALYEPTLVPRGGGDSLSDSGTLSPGVSYRLVLSSAHPGGMDFQSTLWTFDFDIAAVPEPGTGLLIALGLLSVAWSRRD